MYWMLDENFEEERVVRKCLQSFGSGDNNGERRYRTLILMLTNSASGKGWHDARDLAWDLNRPVKQCEQVWLICCEENVLRACGNGKYSAVEWMVEHKYFNDTWRQKQPEGQQAPQQQRQPQPPPVPNSQQRGIAPYQAQSYQGQTSRYPQERDKNNFG